MQCMLGPARKCTAMHRLPLFSFFHSSGGYQNLRTASLDTRECHRLSGITTGSGVWPSAQNEAVGREIVAGRHLTLPVGRVFLQNLQMTATEGKAKHGSTIQGIYAPIMSLIMFVTQKGMCLDSRTTNHAFPCMTAQRIKYATFMSNEMQTIQTNQGPIPITKSRNKACMQDAMQPRHTSQGCNMAWQDTYASIQANMRQYQPMKRWSET